VNRAATLPFSESLGWALYIMHRRGCYASFPIASLWAWLIPAAQLGQMHVFIDREGRVTGYMTWAFLTEEAERSWVLDATGYWRIGDWSGGHRLWIVDFISLPGRTRACTAQAKQVLSRYTEARYLRRTPHGACRVVCRWYKSSSNVVRIHREGKTRTG
jgi:cytolysin-activating lysine-acyltransferase